MSEEEKEIITKFFEAMVDEFAGGDNGHDVFLDESDIERGLKPWFEFYINK
tara:strand:- start:823 stop:975 length:153 start_codon:yes stop_codon:yes gene_type:complete